MYNQQITQQFKEIKNHPSINKSLSKTQLKKNNISKEDKKIKISKTKKTSLNSNDNEILQKKREHRNKINTNIILLSLINMIYINLLFIHIVNNF